MFLLPCWMYRREIEQIAFHYGKENGSKALPLGLVAGGALPMVFTATGMLWIFYPCFYLTVLRTSECHQEKNFAYYHRFVWAAFPPVAFVALLVELHAFRCAALPLYQNLKSGMFRILGFQVPFCVWFVKCMMLSFTFILNFATTAAWVGAARKTTDVAHGCSVRLDIDERWEKMIENAMDGLFHELMPNFNETVSFAFYVSWTGLFLGLCESLPIPFDCFRVWYGVADVRLPPRWQLWFGPEDEDIWPPTTEPLALKKYRLQYFTPWTLLSPSLQNHGSALMALAHCNGMSLLLDNDMRYAHCRIQELRREGVQAKKIIPYPSSQLNRLTVTCLKGIFGTGLQLNLKVTMLGMMGSIRGQHGWEWPEGRLQLMYIFVSFAACMLEIANAYQLLRLVGEWIPILAEEVQASRLKKGLLRFHLGIAGSLFCFYVLIWVYAVGKLLHGMLICPVDKQLVNFIPQWPPAWPVCV